ncbi:hypothetical protein PAPHI01_1527 [Pancytospora philotis]|nr:hypothetical protein PAPHI01_1527 [Pancytospora philotis]
MDSEVSVESAQSFRRYFSRVNALSCVRFLVMLELVVKVLKVASISVTLYIKRHEKVEAPLKVFLGVYCILNVAKAIAFYLKNRAFFRIHRIPDYEENGDVTLVNNCLEAVMLFWYIIGFHWVQECDVCRVTNPLLYYMSYYWILFGFFSFIAPLLAIILLLLLVNYVRPKLKVIAYSSEDDIPDGNYTCTICFDDYVPGVKVKFLPCDHHFHAECIDEWFNVKDSCPLCKKHINLLYELVDDNEGEV